MRCEQMKSNERSAKAHLVKS